MSLYIKVERYKSPPKIIQFRGLCTEIGEDQQGVLSCSPERSFFLLCNRGHRTSLQAKEKNLRLNQEKFEPAQQRIIRTGDVLSANDYRFAFLSASLSAEALAYCKLGLKASRQAWLQPESQIQISLSLAASKKIFPCPNDRAFYLGTDPANAFVVNINGLAEKHCKILSKDNTLFITPLQGTVCWQGNTTTREIAVRQNGQVLLGPSALPLKILFPGSEFECLG